MGSKRLPGKALLPLAGKPMTENIIERVKRAKRLNHVVLAVPPQDENAFAWMPCRVHAPLVDENDLVARYLTVAERCHADIIVRVPCDNPCIEPEYIDVAVETYMEGCYTFLSNTTAYFGNKLIDGLGCEVFSISRLKWLANVAKDSDPSYREHPHQLFYELRDLGHGGICIERDATALRLDVNTEEDYRFIKGIYNHIGHNRFHISEVLSYLESK
jgi:spore coat polysaccharide biosynthesis protein SpsF (cytidylyltransferase family)